MQNQEFRYRDLSNLLVLIFHVGRGYNVLRDRLNNSQRQKTKALKIQLQLLRQVYKYISCE